MSKEIKNNYGNRVISYLIQYNSNMIAHAIALLRAKLQQSNDYKGKNC